MKQDICAGIDVSKNPLDVHVCQQGTIFAMGRDDAGLAELIEALRQLDPALIVLEATGGCETLVASALAAAHLPLAVVDPRRIREFAKAVGKLAKIDHIDLRDQRRLLLYQMLTIINDVSEYVPR